MPNSAPISSPNHSNAPRKWKERSNRRQRTGAQSFPRIESFAPGHLHSAKGGGLDQPGTRPGAGNHGLHREVARVSCACQTSAAVAQPDAAGFGGRVAELDRNSIQRFFGGSGLGDQAAFFVLGAKAAGTLIKLSHAADTARRKHKQKEPADNFRPALLDECERQKWSPSLTNSLFDSLLPTR